jgi:hypothetical protein
LLVVAALAVTAAKTREPEMLLQEREDFLQCQLTLLRAVFVRLAHV